jgi:hypothetical protein
LLTFAVLILGAVANNSVVFHARLLVAWLPLLLLTSAVALQQIRQRQQAVAGVTVAAFAVAWAGLGWTLWLPSS